MPKEVKAIYAYTPRVKLDRVVGIEDIGSFIAGRSTFNEGMVMNMLMELQAALAHYANMGHPVRLNGVGLFSPRINKNGELGMNFKIDKHLKGKMNLSGEFKGEIVNNDMIGKSVEDMINLWNLEHPDEPIEKKDKKDK